MISAYAIDTKRPYTQCGRESHGEDAVLGIVAIDKEAWSVASGSAEEMCRNNFMMAQCNSSSKPRREMRNHKLKKSEARDHLLSRTTCSAPLAAKELVGHYQIGLARHVSCQSEQQDILC